MTTAQTLKNKIQNIERGKLFSSRKFLELGSNRATIDKALSRMVEKGEIKRASRGIFFRPKKNKFIGNVPAKVESVRDVIARQNKEIIQVHGAEAARQFQLSTQMPIGRVFYTNGATRKIKVSNTVVQMIHTSNQRKLQYAGTKVGTAISALWYLGKELVTPSVIIKLRSNLTIEEFQKLKNAKLTVWMKKAINEVECCGGKNDIIL